jgi:hypothetical protein
LFGTDTAAANTLDDYETGTWTPAFVGGTKAYSTLGRAAYVKVGSLVFVQCFISGLSGGDGTDLNIAGLPFATPSNGYNIGSVFYGSGTAFTNVIIRTAQSNTVLNLKHGLDASVSQTDVENFIMLSITYEVV